MAHLIETIAAILGTLLVLGGGGSVVSPSGDGKSAGCVVALVGIALIVLALGFDSQWTFSHFLYG
jgi:hypothetical protein